MATISDDLVAKLREGMIWIPALHEFDETGTSDIMEAAANRIEADTKLIQEMREAILSMVYDDNGIWRAGVIGDMEAPEEVCLALSKAKSQQEGETE